MISKGLRMVLTALVCLGLFSPVNISAVLAQPAAVARLAPAGVPLDGTTAPFFQKAAQHLEDLRGSPMAPGWNATAKLDPTAQELFRPDVAGVAYYEFRVTAIPKPGSPFADAGFIVVSTGPHDFPIPHWNSQGQSPTQALDAQGVLDKVTPAKYYRLDALSYAGEDSLGTTAVMTNDHILKITGIDPGAAKNPPADSTNNWAPSPTADDSKPDTNWKQTQTGPLDANYTFGAWASWSELKAGYTGAYAALLAHLKDSAAPDWALDAAAAKFGERLSAGDTRGLATLCSDPTTAVNGDGKTFVTAGLVQRSGLNPLFALTVNTAEYKIEHTLNITITCPLLGPITYNYIITAPAYRLMLPVIQGGGNAKAVTPASLSPSGDWSSWHYDWAFNAANDARLYDQIQPNSPPPHNSSCYSGCGATAWGMLIGWADYQARAANTWAYWKPRPGLYRFDGGYGADVIAPTAPDNGVYNMIWEIHNWIGTFCFGSSGATFPWRMADARNYLSGRTGARLDTHYNVLGISDGGLRDTAVNSIRYRQTPAIIGTGWLNHYPLAMGYAERSRTTRACDICWWDTTQYARFFWVDQGWGGSGNDWVSADTWFAGELFPY